jgi:hypothetical protein
MLAFVHAPMKIVLSPVEAQANKELSLSPTLSHSAIQKLTVTNVSTCHYYFKPTKTKLPASHSVASHVLSV